MKKSAAIYRGFIEELVSILEKRGAKRFATSAQRLKRMVKPPAKSKIPKLPGMSY